MKPDVLLDRQFLRAVHQLPARDQARCLDFVVKLSDDPTQPGLSLHRLDQHAARGVWSGRISDDLRAILYQDGASWILLHADHHDDAYAWASRRDFGRHPKTGVFEVIESVESIRAVEKSIQAEKPAAKARSKPQGLLAAHDDAYLLSLGVSQNWLPTLRKIENDDQLLAVGEKLPEDVAERLLRLASGELVTPPEPLAAGQPQRAAEDARRRYYVVEDVAGLRAALDAPMERWLAFLHPSQRAQVEGNFRGPAKVTGSAGTGKTVVALHRARHLARQGHSVLLTSYVGTLCHNLEYNLDRLCGPEERRRIAVSTVHKQALDLVHKVESDGRIADPSAVEKQLDSLRLRHAPDMDARFVLAEWEQVLRLQGIGDWDSYRSAARTGRGKGLSIPERKRLWKVFGGLLEALDSQHQFDFAGVCLKAEKLLLDGRLKSPFTAVIVDEVQDLKPPELRFLAALAREHLGNFMLLGDAGQRIYPGGFSLMRLGIDVRGRSSVLKINYRTTEQIRRAADRILDAEEEDMDGGKAARTGTHSLLRGPEPNWIAASNPKDEVERCLAQIDAWLSQGMKPPEIAVFARTKAKIDQVARALDAQPKRTPWSRLDDEDASNSASSVKLGTMHRAKGLEFKGVIVFDVSDSSVPNAYVLDKAIDPQDKESALERERRLLYVAMTRARDALTLTWTGKPSRFLPDRKSTD